MLGRATLQTGLSPNRWVGLFQQLEGSAGNHYYFQNVAMRLTSDASNLQDVRVCIESSPDGTAGSWVLEFVHPVDLVPGGEITLSVYHTRPYVRALCYSTGHGEVRGTFLKDLDEVLPFLIKGEDISLDCATLCEHDCETGVEDVG